MVSRIIASAPELDALKFPVSVECLPSGRLGCITDPLTTVRLAPFSGSGHGTSYFGSVSSFSADLSEMVDLPGRYSSKGRDNMR